jgi:hypothetical protein
LTVQHLSDSGTDADDRVGAARNNLQHRLFPAIAIPSSGVGSFYAARVTFRHEAFVLQSGTVVWSRRATLGPAKLAS